MTRYNQQFKAAYLNKLRDGRIRSIWAKQECHINIRNQITSELKSRGCRQQDLGESIGVSQSRAGMMIAYPTLNNLHRIAAALDCCLEIRLIPFSEALQNRFDVPPYKPAPAFTVEYPEKEFPSNVEEYKYVDLEFADMEVDAEDEEGRRKRKSDKVKRWFKRRQEREEREERGRAEKAE